jgi:outer membrane receptor for ferrienterochelin and colicins
MITTYKRIVLLRFLPVFTLSLLFTIGFAFPSENASVTILRQDNNKPLHDAIVKIIPLNESNRNITPTTGMTDPSGTFRYLFNEPVLIHISHLGYSTITDTLLVVSHKTYLITPSSRDMQDVVVTGQYTSGSVQKSVYEVKVIDSDMIRAKGAGNLREALQNELGIDLGQDQVFGSSMSINGISGEGVKIMVDGVPIVGRQDGKLDLSQININNIERIEIVEGPLSVMYGTDAMGGVVNIITKGFQTEKINVQLKGYYETAGQYNAELNTGFSFKKNQVYLSGGRNFFDGYSAKDSIQRVQDWKPKEQYFADLKYLYTGSKFRVSLTGSFFREMLLSRGEPRRTLNDNGTAWTYKADDAHFLTYRPRTAASVMYRFRENSQLDALFAYSGFFRFGNLYSKDLVTQREVLGPATVHDTSRHHLVLFRGTYTLPAWKDRLNFLFGVEINQEFTYQNRIKDRKQKLADYSAFGMVKVKLAEGLDVQPAIRFSYNTRFSIPLIPSINLRYSYKDQLVFRASYGRGYRAPSLKELFLTFFDSNHALRGNESLKPEDGHSINASINYTRPIVHSHTLHLGVSGFYNTIKNKIDLLTIDAPSPNLDTFEYFNLKKYLTYGGDVSLGYKWKELQLKASAQLTTFELSIPNASEKMKMLSPDFTAMASYLIPKAAIGININYRYTGQKPLFSFSGSFQSGKRFAYHWLDVSLTRNFWKDRIQLTVGGKNLIGVTDVQKQGQVVIGHDSDPASANVGWGRTFFTSLVLRFSK